MTLNIITPHPPFLLSQFLMPNFEPYEPPQASSVCLFPACRTRSPVRESRAVERPSQQQLAGLSPQCAAPSHHAQLSKHPGINSPGLRQRRPALIQWEHCKWQRTGLNRIKSCVKCEGNVLSALLASFLSVYPSITAV